MNLNHLLADSRSRCVYVCVSGGGGAHTKCSEKYWKIMSLTAQPWEYPLRIQLNLRDNGFSQTSEGNF